MAARFRSCRWIAKAIRGGRRRFERSERRITPQAGPGRNGTASRVIILPTCPRVHLLRFQAAPTAGKACASGAAGGPRGKGKPPPLGRSFASPSSWSPASPSSSACSSCTRCFSLWPMDNRNRQHRKPSTESLLLPQTRRFSAKHRQTSCENFGNRRSRVLSYGFMLLSAAQHHLHHHHTMLRRAV